MPTRYLPQVVRDTGAQVLLIGNRAQNLAKVLKGTVAGVVSPVKGVHDTDRVVRKVCTHIAQRYGKVAIDFGHCADDLINDRRRWLV